jgi:hypothetical protein
MTLPSSVFFHVSKKSFQIINQTRQNNEFRFSGGHFYKTRKKGVKCRPSLFSRGKKAKEEGRR